ncbi:acyltransferase [Tenacibaculum agarivorans]|uniref:acyltransferase n=1 Tax=Tenacibaculum agarivorans TaxID=1908389 RepID=UPI00094BA45A|nr:acyltransferase [Tenacibaculum agarivorans]
MKKIVESIIDKLGRKDYKIDEHLSSYNLLIIVLTKLIQFFRGMIFVKLFLKSSKGLIFLGKRTSINHKNKISVGKTTSIGNNVSINALSKKGIKIGDNFTLKDNCIIDCTGVIRDLGEGLSIGDNVGISENCFIQVRGEVIIGNNVIFGPSVSIFSENHNHDDVNQTIVSQGETRKGVIIQDNVWIGTKATILDGVVVGEGSIIAANSVVTKNVEPYTVVAGIPAKTIKSRK